MRLGGLDEHVMGVVDTGDHQPPEGNLLLIVVLGCRCVMGVRDTHRGVGMCGDLVRVPVATTVLRARPSVGLGQEKPPSVLYSLGKAWETPPESQHREAVAERSRRARGTHFELAVRDGRHFGRHGDATAFEGMAVRRRFEIDVMSVEPPSDFGRTAGPERPVNGRFLRRRDPVERRTSVTVLSAVRGDMAMRERMRMRLEATSILGQVAVSVVDGENTVFVRRIMGPAGATVFGPEHAHRRLNTLGVYESFAENHLAERGERRLFGRVVDLESRVRSGSVIMLAWPVVTIVCGVRVSGFDNGHAGAGGGCAYASLTRQQSDIMPVGAIRVLGERMSMLGAVRMSASTTNFIGVSRTVMTSEQ